MPAASPLDLARSAAIEVMIGGLNVLESVGRESMVHDGSGWKVAPRIGLVYNLPSISGQRACCLEPILRSRWDRWIEPVLRNR